MTELTDSAGHLAAQPSPDWPQASGTSITDPAVAAVLARLETLPQSPVADHEAVYNGLHDVLLDALNAEPGDGGPAGNPATGGGA
ncbi:hypothetical protein FDW83_15305 [Pseudarthrobacter sp. NamE2]|uniref:hypothetical protein n=1 Tax=Pseudarthrobacter sp. NamE2 TaxID=2576838 RepID=UPI0010FE4CE7|nr:hypothetical protein [Pseudarthrobacter sp. NamE2]TLM81543.1 hypothetical protein FDW83_15305 [Pseudarthrobacter sp. NamE2]